MKPTNPAKMFVVKAAKMIVAAQLRPIAAALVSPPGPRAGGCDDVNHPACIGAPLAAPMPLRVYEHQAG